MRSRRQLSSLKSFWIDMFSGIRILFFISCFCLLFILSACSLVNVNSVSNDKEVFEKIRNTFRNTKFYGVEFQGNFELWKVYYKGKDGDLRIFYFDPKKEYLFFGEIWTINGTSITGLDIESKEKDIGIDW